jgi:hypothetical protein
MEMSFPLEILGAMQPYLAVAEMTDQRKLTIAKIGNQLSQPSVRNRRSKLCARWRRAKTVAKELPFTGAREL